MPVHKSANKNACPPARTQKTPDARPPARTHARTHTRTRACLPACTRAHEHTSMPTCEHSRTRHTTFTGIASHQTRADPLSISLPLPHTHLSRRKSRPLARTHGALRQGMLAKRRLCQPVRWKHMAECPTLAWYLMRSRRRLGMECPTDRQLAAWHT